MMLSNAIRLMNSNYGGFTPRPILFGNYLVSIDSMLVKNEDGRLYLSQDNGRTYNDGLSIEGIGVIKMIHVFDDGKLLLCDPTKAYYSHDWVTLNESTVLDINGDVYIPVALDNFSTISTTKRQIVDGLEVKCWGNYSTEIGTASENMNVWYTTDKGKTIKSCIKFGITGNGAISERSIRHIHAVDFNSEDNTFWLQTGDHELEPHLIKGTYDLATDTWDWNIVGYGMEFKMGNIWFYKDYAYWCWDHNPVGGVMRCKYADIADISKHERLFTTPNDCMNLMMGERGDMVATLMRWGGTEKSNMLYYSPDRVNFHAILGTIPDGWSDATMYWRIFAPNSKGKILAGVWDDKRDETGVKFSAWGAESSVWIDDMIKNAGFPNAFKPL
ncbi:hypothetical protein [Psychrobacillus sp. L3]|uniref:hypothetical protein n=1 Tax=Psychrobacillus sp. L3 TaxID=3236891 RepID=UPI0036F25A79